MSTKKGKWLFSIIWTVVIVAALVVVMRLSTKPRVLRGQDVIFKVGIGSSIEVKSRVALTAKGQNEFAFVSDGSFAEPIKSIAIPYPLGDWGSGSANKPTANFAIDPEAVLHSTPPETVQLSEGRWFVKGSSHWMPGRTVAVRLVGNVEAVSYYAHEDVLFTDILYAIAGFLMWFFFMNAAVLRWKKFL